MVNQLGTCTVVLLEHRGLEHHGSSFNGITLPVIEVSVSQDMGDSDDDISLADFEVAQPDPIRESWLQSKSTLSGHFRSWWKM